jgi:hypothetical protein
LATTGSTVYIEVVVAAGFLWSRVRPKKKKTTPRYVVEIIEITKEDDVDGGEMRRDEVFNDGGRRRRKSSR